MTKAFYHLTLLLLLSFTAHSQITYEVKVEAGYISFRDIAVNYEPGPNWRGYYLADDGVDLNLINGFRFNPHLYAGVGVGYANYTGISGVNAFVDIEYLILKSKLTPIIELKMGYNHIWNQYEGGHRSGATELCTGINYSLNDKLGLFLKSGIMVMQDAFLVPVRMGLRF